MKIAIIIFLILIALLGESIRYNIVLLISVLWFIYTVYHFIGLYKLREKKITTENFSVSPPNNNHSSHIRYLYSGKVDYKVFVATIIELLIKKSISLVRYNMNEYYLIDNKVKDEVLTKNEEYVKKILFKEIGDSDKISLNQFKKICAKNSGYIYSVYKEWQNVFECESAYNKYFKPIKPVVDNSIGYFCISFIIALYNILFTKKIFIALIIFAITSILIKYVNDYSNKEEDAKVEYEKWLEFKNYIKKYDNTLDELDIISLENYASYAYVLDCYKDFLNVLYRKYKDNPKCFDESVLLSIMNLRIFDDIEKMIYIGIKTFDIKVRMFFARNKGRRDI